MRVHAGPRGGAEQVEAAEDRQHLRVGGPVPQDEGAQERAVQVHEVREEARPQPQVRHPLRQALRRQRLLRIRRGRGSRGQVGDSGNMMIFPGFVLTLINSDTWPRQLPLTTAGRIPDKEPGEADN